MSKKWKTAPASEIRPGDRVRATGDELTVTRIEPAFFGNPAMIALIEETSERWYKRPVALDAEVEIQIA